MRISTLVRYTVVVAPVLLGWSTFAAILMTAPDTDDISWARLVVAFAAWIGIGGGALGGMYLLDRKRPPTTRAAAPGISFLTERKGPDCDRCGEPTGKPFLYDMPKHYWRCEPCEQKVTDLLFAAASNGMLTEKMLSYTRPFPTNRTAEK